MGSLEFCEADHPLLTSLHYTVKVNFMDDVTLSCELPTVDRDARTVLDASQDTGLQLNQAKCQVIMEDFIAISCSSPLNNFFRVAQEK